MTTERVPAMDAATLDRLIEDLGSPDPQVRDEGAYSTLAPAIVDGEIDESQWRDLAAAMVERLQAPTTEARTFAPLILAVLVEVGDWNPLWFNAVRDWYLAEDDLRGHDPQVGWLHAVAHGADFFGACGAAGRVPGEELIDVLAKRALRPTEHVWRDQEEVRLATAIAYALSSPALGVDGATGWLADVRQALEGVGLPTAWSANTLRTLHALHVGLGEQVLLNGSPLEIPHGAIVRDQVADVIQLTQPWFWRRRTP